MTALVLAVLVLVLGLVLGGPVGVAVAFAVILVASAAWVWLANRYPAARLGEPGDGPW